jgi:hypothetical protein
MAIKSDVSILGFEPVKKFREIITAIPQYRVFTFKYQSLSITAKRQLQSLAKRVRFQPQMRSVYMYEINKLLLNEALISIIKGLYFKFFKKNRCEK